MKDQTITNKNGPLPNSSTSKVANEILDASETGAIAKLETKLENSSAKSGSSLLNGVISNAIARAILLGGVSFVGTFFIVLASLRLAQPIPQTAKTNLTASQVASSKPNLNSPYSLVNRIISLASFGYLSGIPAPQNIKISKNGLAGTTLGKSWTQDTAFAPVTSLSAPPPLSGQPLQTISPSQLPPISFEIPPDATPDALPPSTTDSTRTSTPSAIARKKPASRTGATPETTIEVPELPKDSLGKTISTGANARATLVNAAVFSGDRNASSPRFVVKLDESLKSANGKLILPANTTLVTFVRSLSSKPGAAELEAVSVQVDGKEYDLPPGAITFLDSSGSSLTGLKYGDDEPASETTKKTTANTAKKSTPSDSVDNLDNSEVVPSRPSPEQVKDGNKEAIENVMRHSRFFYIPQGTSLKLVVNKTVKL